jgi:hypothetical protein
MKRSSRCPPSPGGARWTSLSSTRCRASCREKGVIDVVVEVSRKAGARERTAYFDEKIATYENDPQMKNFLKTLQGLLK